MSGRRYHWMGIISLFLALLFLSDSLMVHAGEFDTVIGDDILESEEQYEINEAEIWAQINRDELRSLVDADALKETIDLEELREKIDRQPLLEQIKDANLLSGMSQEEILSSFNELNESGELDRIIRDEIGSEAFNAEYIKSNPPVVSNVKVPIISDESPLDYILDPLGLVYQTQAARYGGGNVQEGANVLFRNSNGDYLFSDTSDLLEIVNKGNVPLQVSISAKIENSSDVRMADSGSDLTGDDPSIFMALVGKEGILSVLNDSGSSELSIILDPVPEGTYIYTYNEETKSFESQLSETADESKFDRFYFGVTSRCNPDANWAGVNSLPKITITWKTEPVLTKWDEITEGLDPEDRVRLEAYKRTKLRELREEAVEKLVDIQLEELVYEELDRLIDLEVERLAEERFQDLKELAIVEYKYDQGEEILTIDENDALNNAIEAQEKKSGDIVNTEDIENPENIAGEEKKPEDIQENSPATVDGAGDENNLSGKNSSTGATLKAETESNENSAVLGAVRQREESSFATEDDSSGQILFLQGNDYTEPSVSFVVDEYGELTQYEPVTETQVIEEQTTEEIISDELVTEEP